MKKICLVGCGNVGSRHLQAIAKMDYAVAVEIVEPSQESTKLGKQRLAGIDYNKESEFSWLESIDETEKPDLTIVATTATGRADLLCRLAKMNHSRFMVEKMVCQSDEEYERVLNAFDKQNAKGWVNTNPRCFASYQRLKNYFADSDRIHLSVTASNVSALGTNTVHYMDLFSFFTDDYNIKLSGDFLIDEIFPNKRGSHLMEFAGTVAGNIKNGSTLTLSFLPSDNLPTVVNIVGDKKHILVDETNQKILDMVNHEDEKFSFVYEHASTLTIKITDDILEKDSCQLTTIEDSRILHKEIFRIFNSHINKITGKQMEICPIT